MISGTKGTVWPAERHTYTDAISGATIHQMTDYRAHSHHLYFTENGWYDDNRRFLFISDRGNQSNLYSMELATGEMTQLTDLQRPADDLAACLNAEGNKAYFRHNGMISELDLNHGDERSLYPCPEGFKMGNLNVTADGEYLITVLTEDLSRRIRLDLGNGYVGHRELMEAEPICRNIKIPLHGGEPAVVHEEHKWFTHINTSPVHPDLITYCHEGPWHLVDHRIWGCNIRTGETWKIRERTEPLEKVGHEYWLEDGEYIGYHGFRANGTGFCGRIRYDNTKMEEFEFSLVNWHAHSNDFNHVVVDGRIPLMNMIYWHRQPDGTFGRPKVLCEHRCSFHSQKLHAHPRFSPDGKYLLYTSDRNGYGNIYMLEMPERPEQLPDYRSS